MATLFGVGKDNNNDRYKSPSAIKGHSQYEPEDSPKTCVRMRKYKARVPTPIEYCFYIQRILQNATARTDSSTNQTLLSKTFQRP